MKFFLAIAALVAVAAASPVAKPALSDYDQMEEIIAAIHSPNTDPATAALLEQMVQEIIAALHPIAVGPAIIPEEVVVPQPGVPLEPAWIDTPIPPSPVVVGPIPEGAPAPLVQIIINVKPHPTTPNVPVSLEPAWVDSVPVEPVNVVEVNPEPIEVVQPIEPVIIGTPIIPSPAVILPEELN